MNPVPSIIAQVVEDVGTLANNNQTVESLRSALSSGEGAARLVPLFLSDVIDEDAWVDRLDQNGRRFTFDRDAFLEFLTASAPKGLEMTKEGVRKYLGDSGNPLRVKFEAMVEARPGGMQPSHPKPTQDNAGRFTVLHPDDPESADTAITPNGSNGGQGDESEPHSRATKTGNTIGYAVRRLAREAEKDPGGLAAAAYERLKAGKISAHAAAVEAGHRPRSVTVPVEVKAVSRMLIRHFTRDQIRELIAILGEADVARET